MVLVRHWLVVEVMESAPAEQPVVGHERLSEHPRLATGGLEGTDISFSVSSLAHICRQMRSTSSLSWFQCSYGSGLPCSH